MGLGIGAGVGFRRSLAIHLYDAEVPLRQIMAITGHASLASLTSYLNLEQRAAGMRCWGSLGGRGGLAWAYRMGQGSTGSMLRAWQHTEDLEPHRVEVAIEQGRVVAELKQLVRGASKQEGLKWCGFFMIAKCLDWLW